MKDQSKIPFIYKQCREFWLQQHNLRKLRYGNSSKQFAKPLLTLRQLAKVFRCSKDTIQYRIRKASKCSYHTFQSRWNTLKLQQQHCDFLSSPQTLSLWSHLSLAERAVFFHRQFPETKISSNTLRNFYYRNRIKLKSLVWQKKQKANEEQLQQQRIRIMKEIDILQSEGYKLIQVDEAIFSKNTIKKKSWRQQNQLFQLGEQRQSLPVHAVVAGISKEVGLEAFLIQKKSIKINDFVSFLRLLREKNTNLKLGIFCDNLRLHHSKVIQEEARKLEIKILFNLPYQPAYNGIEFFWNLAKQCYKKVILNKMINNEEINVPKIIRHSLFSIKDDNVKSCFSKGFTNLRQSIEATVNLANI